MAIRYLISTYFQQKLGSSLLLVPLKISFTFNEKKQVKNGKQEKIKIFNELSLPPPMSFQKMVSFVFLKGAGLTAREKGVLCLSTKRYGMGQMLSRTALVSYINLDLYGPYQSPGLQSLASLLIKPTRLPSSANCGGNFSDFLYAPT